MKNADEFKLGLGIEPDSIQPYIYTGCYWKNITRPLLKEFLAVAANKADFNYYDIRLSRNLERLYNQFVALCTLVPDLNEKKDEVKINLKNGTFVISKDKQELRDFDKRDFFKYQLLLFTKCFFKFLNKSPFYHSLNLSSSKIFIYSFSFFNQILNLI